jgi:hypothetical protein
MTALLTTRPSAGEAHRSRMPSEAVVPGKQAGRSLSGKAIAGDGWRVALIGRLRCRQSACGVWRDLDDEYDRVELAWLAPSECEAVARSLPPRVSGT